MIRHYGDKDTCAICGGEYLVTGSAQKYCPLCRERLYGKSAPRKRTYKPIPPVDEKKGTLRDVKCVRCGMQFGGGPAAKYCPSCRRERERDRDRARKLTGANRPLGSEDKCEICGKLYIVESGTQKYCADCKREAYLAQDRKGGMAYYANTRDAYNLKRGARRRAPIKSICSICGKEFEHKGTRRQVCSDDCHEIRLLAWLRDAKQRRAGKRKYHNDPQKQTTKE